MECSSRIGGLYINTLLLLSWAVCSLTVQQNLENPESISQPTNSDNHSDAGHFLQANLGELIVTYYSHIAELCWQNYTMDMSRIDPTLWCEWQRVNRPYNILQNCLEKMAEDLHLSFPNDVANYYIMQGHRTYFVNCTFSTELVDPPEHVLLALILTPICLIPFLVTIVVFKSKTSKPQT